MRIRLGFEDGEKGRKLLIIVINLPSDVADEILKKYTLDELRELIENYLTRILAKALRG